MANKKSAKKRAVKSAAQREKNRAARSKMHSVLGARTERYPDL